MLKIGFVSLGCPKNQLDTEVMLGHIAEAGYEITPDETEADIVVINTCAFIEEAKKEAIDNILDIAWLKEHNNLKGIIVTGCLAERYREEVEREMPEVDAVLGTGSVHSIVSAIEAVERGERFSEFKDKNEVALGGDRIVTTGDAMAYLKISEGCNNRCTYCAIPLAYDNRQTTAFSVSGKQTALCYSASYIAERKEKNRNRTMLEQCVQTTYRDTHKTGLLYAFGGAYTPLYIKAVSKICDP